MIDSYRFGEMQIRGTVYTEDLVILPTRIVSHWRRRYGHKLTSQDIASFMEEIRDIVVIGMGRFRMMKVSDQLIHDFHERDISIIMLPTSDAWKRFNELHAAGRKVTGMFHLTC